MQQLINPVDGIAAENRVIAWDMRMGIPAPGWER